MSAERQLFYMFYIRYTYTGRRSSLCFRDVCTYSLLPSCQTQTLHLLVQWPRPQWCHWGAWSGCLCYWLQTGRTGTGRERWPRPLPHLYSPRLRSPESGREEGHHFISHSAHTSTLSTHLSHDSSAALICRALNDDSTAFIAHKSSDISAAFISPTSSDSSNAFSAYM